MKTSSPVAVQNNMFWKITGYVFCAFFIIFPFINYSSFLFTGASTRAINLILLASVLGIIFGLLLLTKKDLRNTLVIPKSPIIVSLSAYFLWVFVSGFFGLNFSTSFWSIVTRMTGLWYLVSLGFFIFLLLGVISEKARHQKVILSIVFSTALYSVLSFLGPEGTNFLFKGYQSDGFTFGNSSFAGMYIFGVFMLSLYYFFQSEKKKWWMYLLPVLLVINPNIISLAGGIGEARMSTLAILLSVAGLFFVWLVSKIKDRKMLAKISYSIFGAMLLVGVFSTISLLSHDGFLRKLYLSQATAARPLVWEVSEKSIKQHPFLGWGTENFERVFEANYDNRLLQNEYGNEAWFDRAHNVFIDQAIDNGIVGLSLYLITFLVIVLSLLFVALNSLDRKDKIFASILIVYFPLHFLELQTVFDTSISYPLLAFMLASSVVLFDRTWATYKSATSTAGTTGASSVTSSAFSIGKIPACIFGAALVIFFTWSLFWGVIPFVRAQIANGSIRTVGSSEKRIPMYETLFNSPVDAHAFLWRTSNDFKQGIGKNPSVLSDPAKVESLKKEMLVMEDGYRKYLSDNPNHFRSYLNLADVLIYQNLFRVDKLSEAQELLDQAIKLVPQSPQPYWMKSVAYLYAQKFDLAREYANKALALNPKITGSQELHAYIERSIKSFPNIGLYNFSQI